MQAYTDFLERQDDLIWRDGDDGELPTMLAEALVVTAYFGIGSIDFTLKGGAIDRLYGDGVDPDPCAEPAVAGRH